MQKAGSYFYYIAADGFHYSDQLKPEKRAYAMEEPMVRLMNFQGWLALKTLESKEYDEATKVGIMNYVGAAFRLNSLQNHPDRFKGTEMQKVEFEKQISKLTEKVNELSTKYESQIAELSKKNGREVKLIVSPTERRSVFGFLNKKKK